MVKQKEEKTNMLSREQAWKQPFFKESVKAH